MKSAIDDLPEMRVSGWGVLTKTLSLFARNAGALLLIAAIIALPIEALKNYFLVSSYEGPFSTFARDSLVSLLFLCVLTPVVTYYLMAKLRNEKASILQSYLWGIRKWLPMITYSFLQGVIVSAGFILLIVPGILMSIRLLMLPIIVSVENTSIMNPLEVSRNMSVGRFWRMLGYAVLVMGVVLVVALIGLTGLDYIIPEYWILMTVYDVLYDWLYLLFTVLLIVIYLKLKTEAKDAAQAEKDNREVY
ncbi:MAG: hypothetical protein ACE3L7_27485 [Candidatus Pristimantibacillus sp.]